MRQDNCEKTAVITGSFISYNYGAMALIIASLAELRAAYPRTRFIKTSVERDLDRARYGKAIPDGSLQIFGMNKGRLPMAVAAPLLLIKSISVFKQADLVLDIIGEVPNTGWFLSQAARIAVARFTGTPYVIYGSSIGPFQNRLVRRLAARTYKKVDKILVREPVSYEYLERMGMRNLTLTADNAFLLPAEPDDELNELANSMSPFVVFSAKKDYADSGAKDATVYKKTFVETLKYVKRELGLNIIVVPHDETDSEINSFLALETGDNGVIVVPPGKTPQQLKYLVSKARFAVGSRIHFCIAAMSTAVPVICFLPRVDHRGLGMMRFLGLEDFVIDPGAEESRLIEAVTALDHEHDAISYKIAEKLPEADRLAARNKESAREYLA